MHQWRIFVRVLLAFAVVAFVANDERTRAAQAPSGDTVAMTRDVMVSMRDGVRLATDIYFPAQNGVALEGRRPVVLERTPYRKSAMLYMTTPFLQNGYIVILQDVRGRYGSEGRWRPLRDDVNDGADTARWIGAQPWSDGSIGTMGSSYDGGTQHALAIGNAPYVKAMFARNAMSNMGHYGVRHNGAFELRWANWVAVLGNVPGATAPAETAKRANGNPDAVATLVEFGKHAREFVRQLPLRPGSTPLRLAPDYEAWLVEAMSHGDYDRFWKDSGSSVVDHLDEYKDVPVYHTTGWYDSWTGSVANLNYVALRKSKRSLQRLIIGPWLHSAENLNYAGEAQFTDDASVDLPRMHLAWYNHFLKGIDNGVDGEAPVRIYVMGGGDAHKTKEGRVFVGGRWRDEADWPLARAVATPYYLHENGLLSTERASDRSKTYQFDPRNPVPTIGGGLSSQGDLALAGAADQRCRPDFWQCNDASPFSSRADVLVFQTPPLENDVEVTGRLIVNLWASTDGRDTDFTAKLIDVYPPNADFPDGVALNVSDSIVRGRYRKGPGKPELLTPGRPYEFTIEMYPTSLLFKRGHRVRLDISSSNFPRFDVNPNTGEPLNANTQWRTATNTIYMNQQHASRITLPVIPAM